MGQEGNGQAEIAPSDGTVCCRDGERSFQDGLEGVVREMASGWVAEGRLPGLINGLLLRWSRAAWFYTRLVRYGLRQPGHFTPPVARTDTENVLVAVDLTPVLPGGDNGGAKVLALRLVATLARLRPGWRFVCLVADAAWDELALLDAPNVERARIGFFGRRRGLSHWLGRPVDLLFCPFTRPYFRHPGVPVVSVVYDLQYAFYPQFFSPREAAGRERTFQCAARLAARLVCISEYTRRTVLERGNVPPARVTTIPIVLPHRLQRAAPEAVAAVRDRLGLGGDGYLLYPANGWPHKNHRLLLVAFGMFVADRPESRLRLVLTGADTGLGRELAAALPQLGLADRVVFAGYVSDDDLAALLTGATALIFPSLFEGFGMPLVEAMAVGTPILCSDATSLPEVGGDAALYFDPRRPEAILTAMVRLVDEPGLPAALVAKGRERLAQWGDSEAMARAYLDVFSEVLARPVAQSTAVRGLGAGGLVGPELLVAFGPAAHRQWLAARFALPAEAGCDRLTVTVERNGKAYGRPLTLKRGRSLTVEPDLPACGGYVAFRFSPGRGLPVPRSFAARRRDRAGSPLPGGRSESPGHGGNGMRIGFDVSQTGPGRAGCGAFAAGLLTALAHVDTVNDYVLYPAFGDFFREPHPRSCLRPAGQRFRVGPTFWRFAAQQRFFLPARARVRGQARLARYPPRQQFFLPHGA